jgi:hypothetical protein
MTAEEAIALTRKLAEERGWPWYEPVDAWSSRHYWLWGRRYWHVFANANCRGLNTWAMIDDETGEILKAGYQPM